MRHGNYEASDKSTAGTAITFLFIGLGAGALIALLFAPKAGEQLRRDLRRGYEDARDAVETFAEEARDRVEEVIEKGADWVESAREKAEPLRSAMRRK
ncbi:MAG: YtxH domain-containing protein [Acidobacteria bacterium]|nr:YtxH domain-containing protein [Acidobacteriota bacterium]MBV8894198.1 YtxH domain-containing protein [Acidobacteriota bacterium]MBV9483348.1 YtxH domain-containing protein [Acidobacteriota bacterium]